MLILENISKKVEFKEVDQTILSNISFTIFPGEFVAIIGKSGSGKTTLMNILGCLDKPTSGVYSIGGVNLNDLSSDQLADLRCSTFGFIFQNYNLLSSLSVIENVALPAVYANISHTDRVERAKKILCKLDLANKLTEKPHNMSGGQQQRVSIARAIMNGGSIILADEPTGALDTQSGQNVMNILCELNAKGHTIIIVTHDSSVAAYADRIIEIQEGKVVHDSSKKKPNKSDKYSFALDRTCKKGRENQILESFSMALHAILSHKLRSVLTALGIIIGIASVVIAVALGQGAQKKIILDIQSLGTSTIRIFPGKNFGDTESWRIKTLKFTDSDILSSQSYIDSASPSISSQGTVTYRAKTAIALLEGVNEQFFSAMGIQLLTGRLLKKEDISALNSVAIIDQHTQKTLFGDRNPLNNIIFFDQKPLTVIGVVEQGNSIFSNAENLSIWVPCTTAAYKFLGSQDISSLVVKVAEGVNSQVAEKNITLLLTNLHKGIQDFFTFNSDSIKKTIGKTTQTLTLLTSGVAFISLLAGGIGVMNIMLVSVTERTSEIGMRMAVGARRSHILSQFIIESVLLCVAGGFLGVIISFVISYVVAVTFPEVYLSLSISIITLSLCCSFFIGVLFGFIPAKNASKLTPVNALARS